ncbi:MAG: LysR family transcriptional regulator [Rhodopseudomonas palustris]|uniref:LysR family transcriptional regulator n=1 Tax=Rhodopseudomonas palustris TaxID=1076 RepID=A0A933S2D5_RHOPL|nr:LysR family transcriptional regulator [Rhodopseudomonas palustris]
MSMDEINVFVEVVDAQSFTRAARRLGLPTTTVSAKLARLEARLGVTLIQRTTRQLHVTPAGRAYHAHCVRALAEIAEGEQALAAEAAEPSGLLRITAAPDLAHSLLAPLVERFLQRHPKAGVELIVTNTTMDLIAAGIDLAVRAGPLADSSLVVRRFRAARIGLWASPDYLARAGTPMTPADLARHAFIRFSRMGDRIVLSAPSGEAVALPVTSRLASDDLENVRTFIARGNGIGPLPEFVGRDARNAVPLVPVLPGYASELGAVHFVYPAQRYVPKTVRAFLDIATEGGD